MMVLTSIFRSWTLSASVMSLYLPFSTLEESTILWASESLSLKTLIVVFIFPPFLQLISSKVLLSFYALYLFVLLVLAYVTHVRNCSQVWWLLTFWAVRSWWEALKGACLTWAMLRGDLAHPFHWMTSDTSSFRIFTWAS